MAGKREPGRGFGRDGVGIRLCERDPADPAWRAVELAQRGRMILDVTAADLEAAEAAYGPFHPTAWHFRNALYEARKSWDRLRAEFGGAKLDAALEEPPLTVLPLGPEAAHFAPGPDARWPLPEPTTPNGHTRPGLVLLILIVGQTYRALRVAGTPLAPLIWQLTHLRPSQDPVGARPRPHSRPRDEHEDGPYYACRLHDGSTQCDCAEWIYRIADADPPGPEPALCKHLAALAALGWLGEPV
jgi:hypothetical protein